MIASQVPVTFRPRHLQGFFPPSWQLATRGPTRRSGSASEVHPSEVFPLAAWNPVSGALPSCRSSLGSSSTSGSGSARIRGSRYSSILSWVSLLQGLGSATRQALSRDLVPSCAWLCPSPRGRARLRFKVCSATDPVHLSRGERSLMESRTSFSSPPLWATGHPWIILLLLGCSPSVWRLPASSGGGEYPT